MTPIPPSALAIAALLTIFLVSPQSLGSRAIPDLKGVAPQEMKELRATASAPNQRPLQISFALANENPKEPYFYVTTNLPEGAKIDLIIEGMPGTLLSDTAVRRVTQVTIEKGLGKSKVIRTHNEGELPRGEYKVTATDSGDQSDEVLKALMPVGWKPGQPSSRRKHPVFSKVYFLGGAQDASYEASLSKSRTKAAANIRKDLEVCRPIAAQLATRLDETEKGFARVRALGASSSVEWAQFSAKWTAAGKRLDQQMDAWKIDEIRVKSLAFPVYRAELDARHILQYLHKIQGDFLSGKRKETEVVRIDGVARKEFKKLSERMTELENLARSSAR